jgi:hypothetical protein
LQGIVFQNREVLSQAETRQRPKHGEGQDHRGKPDAEGDPRFAIHIKVRCGQNAAHQETG